MCTSLGLTGSESWHRHGSMFFCSQMAVSRRPASINGDHGVRQGRNQIRVVFRSFERGKRNVFRSYPWQLQTFSPTPTFLRQRPMKLLWPSVAMAARPCPPRWLPPPFHGRRKQARGWRQCKGLELKQVVMGPWDLK